MWLELIAKLLSETNLTYLNADLPLAYFMIKLLPTRIKFDKFINLQTFQDYLESIHVIKLRYFIQSTIKDEINQECILDEGKYTEDLKELDDIFFEYHDEQPVLVTPSYEKQILLYKKYIEGNEFFPESFKKAWQGEIEKRLSRTIGAGNDYEIIKSEIKALENKKICENRKLEKTILHILNHFNTKENFINLLKSIREIKLMENHDLLLP